MRDSNRLTRPAPRAAIVGVLATFVSFALLPGGVAAASITLFEPILFDLGSVNGQSGVGGFPWKSSPPGTINCVDWPVATPPTTHTGQYDEAVVANTVAPPGDPPGFGSQSLRMSNACASGEFFYQTYSPRESVQVGEERVNKVFMAQFSFMSKTPAYQPGLFLSVSPDSGEGSRMSWVGLEDTPAGIRVSAADTPEVDGEFVDYPDLALLDRTNHTRSGSGSRSTAARTTTWCESPSTIVTSVSASRRGRTTTAPLRSRRRRRTPIRQRTSTACSSAPACRGPLPSPVVATCSTT